MFVRFCGKSRKILHVTVSTNFIVFGLLLIQLYRTLKEEAAVFFAVKEGPHRRSGPHRLGASRELHAGLRVLVAAAEVLGRRLRKVRLPRGRGGW